MTYIVKSNEKYLVFERYVRDMDIVVNTEETSYIQLATTFSSEEDAKAYIQMARDSGYESDNFTIIDKDKKINDDKTAEENARLESKRKQWNNLSTDDKRAYLSRINEEDQKKFLADMQDTSGITPMTPEEMAMRKIHRHEETLGIKFTEEQIQILLKKEVKND